MTSKVEKTMETYTQMSQNIQALVEKVNAILVAIGANGSTNIDAMLDEIKKEALKVAKNPLDNATLQAQLEKIETALQKALKRIEDNGGVDMDALKTELRADLERVKTELEASAKKIQAELKTGLDKANEQVQAIAGAKDAILQEVTDKLKKIVESVGSGSKVDYDEIVGDRDIQIELLHGASTNQPASTLSFLDWAEYVVLDKTGKRRYLKIKGFGRDRTIIQHKRDGEIYYYDILANIKEPIIKVIPLNGNYMLVCQENNYVYMLGLDWQMLGAFQDISNPMGAIKMHFDSPVVTAHCTGDTTYVLLENGDLWASGRNPYTFGHNNNIDSYNAWTKTAFKNIKSMEYVADRSLDNRNGIAVLDSANMICSVGGQGRYLTHDNNLGNCPTIVKNITSDTRIVYERVWCLANAVIAFRPDNAYTYGIGNRTGSYAYQYHWNYICTQFKPIKVLADSEKTMYLLADKRLLCSTGCYHWNGSIQYGNSKDNTNGKHASSVEVQNKVIDMATYNNRWIIKKEDKTLWTWGLDAEKFAGISALSGVKVAAFKINEGADDFVCGKNFTAVLKGKTISVSRELIIGNGFVDIYTAPTKPKKETTGATEQQTTERE